MKRFVPLLLVVGVICIAAGLYFALSNRSSAIVNSSIEVPAGIPWTNSGLTVSAGQPLNITASGTVVWKNISNTNPNAYPKPYEECGPTGTPPVDPKDYYSNISQYQCSQCNKGALIAKVGDSVPFLVGGAYAGQANASGVLYFGINEMKTDPTSYADNSGKFVVEVK